MTTPTYQTATPKSTSLGEHRDLVLEIYCTDRLAQVNLQHIKTPRVLWSPRLTTTAGIYETATRTIRLNPRLTRYTGEIYRTLLHELAHTIARDQGGHGHGPLWKRACEVLGIPGESRTHNLELRQKVHVYECPSCAKQVHYGRRRFRFACGKCCTKHNGGQYHVKFRVRYIETREVLS